MGEESDNRVSIQFPPDILELAEKFAKERIAKERAEKERQEAEKAEQICVRAARLQLGLEYATKVFQWAEALRVSGPGVELMKKAYGEVIFFDGHVENIPWMGLGISTRKGLFLTRGGRMSALFKQTITSPEDLAMAVETEILRTASEWIENGGVWGCIRRRLDYLKEKK